MEEKTTQLIRHLNMLFRVTLLSSILIGVFLPLLISGSIIDTQLVNLESAAILSLLGCIPLALWLYHKKIVSETLPDDVEQKVALICKWFTIRLGLVAFAFLFNVIVYALTKNESFLYCCGIAFMILLFLCRPNKVEITKLLESKQVDE